jgi:cobalamin 5'-phosphate synthase/cobalamin synthase
MLVAASFLTRLRLPAAAGAVDVGASVRWFPLVGAMLGCAGAAAAWVLRELGGMPSTMTAAIVVALGAWVTGAIHLDGLADMADGFGGGRTRDDVLRIMRDSSIGSYGATALVLALTIKVLSVAELLQRGAGVACLVVAPALGRWTVVALAAWVPYARSGGGLGQAVAGEPSRDGLPIATLSAAVVAVAALRLEGIVLLAVAAAVILWVGRLVRRRIGGVTGDVFGAAVELTETAVLVGAVLITGKTS